MKRTPLRKKSKQKISTIQNKIWDECKRIVRKRYTNSCYTCSVSGLSGSNLQTGHMWPKASVGAFLKYDLRILRIQCARCNLFFGGMGAAFYKRMLSEIGPEKMEELEKDRQKIVKAYDFYVELLEKYKEM